MAKDRKKVRARGKDRSGFARWLDKLDNWFHRGRVNFDSKPFEKSVFSQNGEDGILEAIFEIIGTTNRYFVEFGVEDGSECNTRFLREEKGWTGLMMDGADPPGEGVMREFITAENITELFGKHGVPEEFDLLSIDIDSNDYWVWKAIEGYSPRVVVMEYNSSIPASESKTVAYDPELTWDGTNYFGASLLALTKLGSRKGFDLLCCDKVGVNAFFIRRDVFKKHFRKQSVDILWRPPRYGQKDAAGNHTGHPPGDREMVEV
ncbi:MAG: hypothetical protein AAGA58_03415 [Verrucomicrobiota bacterium]